MYYNNKLPKLYNKKHYIYSFYNNCFHRFVFFLITQLFIFLSIIFL